MKKIIVCLLVFYAVSMACGQATGNGSFVSTTKGTGYFTLCEPGVKAPMYIDTNDFAGVIRATKDLRADIGRVTGSEPDLKTSHVTTDREIVIAGTIGKNAMIDRLIRKRKIDGSVLAEKYETFIITVIDKPVRGIDRALVIAGSDKRGTIYGIYELSKQIGVSPWYWWADVPVSKKDSLYIRPGVYSLGEPAVRYRGIFINDEAPALSGWTNEKFGGFNHKLYEKVFELILRLKGNFLWPAMWGNAFYDDDTLNPKLADEYGIVIGTSHHEPMMRAHDEWRRYGKGPWNYEANDEQLKQFWEEGIRRSGSMESIVTLGMRGDGDMPMSEESNIALLERIIKDQRVILQETSGNNVEDIPQVWALYKEVQDYYNKGMRVPDDVTLLLCDDNWGNVRRLPPPQERERRGGYGMYYHFDFVGGPRNYKWLNTVQIQRVWEQMHLSYRYGVDRIWIVNVGDIKPMEFPISFFLDYAWDPEKWPAERLDEYTRLWAAQQFGIEHAGAIADILTKYTQFNARRKPEMLSPETYSLLHYREAERVVAEYYELSDKAQRIYDQLPESCRDAYYQLVLFPVLACSNLNGLYVTVGKNHLAANQGRSNTNRLASEAKELFRQDSILTRYFHTALANGKWNHMMSQTHIGYTSWQQPEKNRMPRVQYYEPPAPAEMGVAVEGSEDWQRGELATEGARERERERETETGKESARATTIATEKKAVLPVFTVFKPDSHYIEIFNRGQTPFDYEITCPETWIKISAGKGKVKTERRIWISVKWDAAPSGYHCIPITITCEGSRQATVFAKTVNPVSPGKPERKGFIESAGCVSMEAEHYTRAIEGQQVKWLCIPGIGRTLSGMTPMPVTALSQVPGHENSPRLEYEVFFTDTGRAEIMAYFSPTLNFTGGEGLRYAFSVDDEEPQVVNLHENETVPDWLYPKYWNDAVSNYIKIKTTEHHLGSTGRHTLKFWMVDPGLVLQKIVVDMGGVKPSYLGPPESHFH